MMRIVSKTSLCSSLALATALMVGAKPASAQVVGNLNNAGGAAISGNGTSVILNAPQTTIDWTATGAPVSGVRDFLPSANSMTFSGSSDFAVLNRVSSGSDMIGLNGTITSTVGGVRGGTVFFYNPNGIVVGNGANIDVGSLGLTTSDPGTGNNWFGDFNGASPTLTFSGVTNGASQIDIRAGATIASNGNNSFIALVAPKVSTAGTIKTDGDVALVAAEAATLTFSSNYDLYSIQVDVGTGVSDSLNVTGGSIGRNSAVETSGVARRAYLVTVPKNDATTLLISGGASLGFDVANSAVVEGNSIILASGRDTAFVGGETPGGAISIGQSSFSSGVDAYATDSIAIAPGAGLTHFLTTAEFNATNLFSIDASAGDVLFDDGFSADVSHFGGIGEAATGGNISLLAANGHSLTVTGDADLTANGNGGYVFEDGVDGMDGTGGHITVTANGGQIDVGGLYATANGNGGVSSSNATSGDGTGGVIEIQSLGGGSISANYASLDARGEGGSTVECSSCAISGGEGRGGGITIVARDSGSALDFGSLYASASGSGGAGDALAGDGFGGFVAVDLTGLVTADFGESTYLVAYGEGGFGLNDAVGGDGTGGYALVTIKAAGTDQPSLDTEYLTIDASGDGGYSGNGNDGGVGTGGGATISINGGDLTANYVSVSAVGRGGYSWNAISGDSNGGNASVFLTDATVGVWGSLYIDAGAEQPSSEGAPANGNISTGGVATFNVTNSKVSTNLGGEAIGDSLWVGATAYAASGSDGFGGSATGGSVVSAISGSTIDAGDMVFDARAVAGDGGGDFGGAAQGGSVDVTINNSAVSGNGLFVTTLGQGGSSDSGAGGAATGGFAKLSLTGGADVSLASTLEVNSSAQGGDGTIGGAATAGAIDVAVDNSSLTAGTSLTTDDAGIILSGWATAGDGSDGDGGDATASGASLRVLNNGSVDSTAADIDSDARGGDSTGGTRAGNADAGYSRIVAQGGGAVTLSGAANVHADALGGTGSGGADGGDASAESLALLNAINGGSINIDGDLTLSVNRTGGDGQNGGSAFAIIDYQFPTVDETFPVAEILSQGGSVTIGGLTTMTADSIGGDGSSGGAGGSAYGGTVSLRALNSAVAPSVITLGNAVMTATATAGDGGQGVSSETGNGGNGGAGGDALGGMIFVQAMSLDGQITTGDLTLTTTAQAGSGGDGGYGLNGGNGGQGGTVATNWSAGAINISMPSGGNPVGLPLVTNGFIHVGDINATTSATGGNGGWGGYATDSLNGINGTAGNGGYAQSGDFYVINRGGDIAGGDLNWEFDANGGAAGSNPNETAAGVGGSASIGQLILVNTNRTGQNDQRGTLSFGDVTGIGTASGGFGLVGGSSLYTSSLDFETINADTHLGSLTYQANASDGPAVSDYNLLSLIAVQNGSALIDGALTVAVPGAMAVWLENGSLTANSIDLSASDFVHRDGPAPTTFGTIHTATLAVSTGNDLIIDADLDMTDSALNLSAPGSISIGSGTSVGSITLNADTGFVLSHDLDAIGDIALTAAGNIGTQALTATGDVTATATGALSTAAISAGGSVSLSGDGITVGGATSAGGSVDMTSTQSLVAGDIASAGNLSLMAAGNLTAGALTTDYGVIDVYAGQNLSIDSADSGNDLYLTADAGNLLIAADSTALGGIELEAGGLVQTAGLTAQATISVVGGAIDIGDVFAGADLGGGIGGLALNPGADIGLWSDSTLDAGDLFATSRIGIAAPGAIATGSIEAGDLIMILGGDDISTGSILAGGEIYIAGYDLFALGYDPEAGDFDPTPILSQFPTATGGDVAVGGTIGGTRLRANAGGGFSSGAITTSDAETAIQAGGNIDVGNVNAATQIGLTSANGSVDALDLVAGGSISAVGDGTVTVRSASANGGYLDLISTSGGVDVTTGGASASGGVYINAAGPVSVAGAINSSSVQVFGGGNIVLHDVTSANDLGVVGGGTLAIGDASAGGDVWLAAPDGVTGGTISGNGYALVFSNGPVQLTALNASSDGGLAGIGGMAAFDAGNIDGFLPGYGFDAIGSSGPSGAATVGSISAYGVNTNSSAMTLGDLDASFATITATGLVSATGAWSTQSLDVQSGDIQIGANASIVSDVVNLASTNTTGAAIGDGSGAPQGSWLLDAAEMARIDSGYLQVAALDTDAAVDLFIGTVDLAGGGRTYEFGVGSDGALSGRLRVTGKVTGSGWSDDDTLNLGADTVEVEAVNGGIDFSPNSDQAVGTLGIYAPHFHVAEASILDKLEANLDYAGRDAELAVAPTAAHSGTTINVGLVELYLDWNGGQQAFAVTPLAIAPYSIFAQNMGTAAVPSGLLIRDAEIFGDYAPGSIDMVIYGQWQTPGGTLVGAAVRDAFIADPENDLAMFTANSSINGCPLTGASCEVLPPPPPPPPQTPPLPPPATVGDLPNQIVLLDTSIGDMLFFGDDMYGDDDDNSSDEDGVIDPPPMVIDGRALDPQTATDEPVSGSGNPALIGTGSNQQQEQQ